MKRILLLTLLIIIAAFAYLNFVYLPQKVKAEGPAYLEQKSKGRVQAASIQYIPFRGVELKGLRILSKEDKVLLAADKIYFNVKLWPLIMRRDLDFRIDLYPAATKQPFIFTGLYQIKQQKLDVYCRKLNLEATFYIQDQDLRIEKLSGKIAGCAFALIGDVQNLADPLLNIYGDVELNLAEVQDKLNLQGRCQGKLYISSQAKNPEIGLKMKATQIKIDKINIEDLSFVSKMKDKEVSLTKCYARLYDGEVNLEGTCRLDAQDFPADLSFNLFNVDMHKLIKDIKGRDTPVHGRLFSLGRLGGHLKRPGAVEGKVWMSISGSNILQLRAFEGIADVLRLPELRKLKFKQASGNFNIARQKIKTEDFKISGNNMEIYFQGDLDFDGNVGAGIQPYFSADFLSRTPNIKAIAGIFIDPAGNFLGEIKMKGNIKNPRYTFKPISMEKLLPRAIEEGLKQLFKLKKKEEENQ